MLKKKLILEFILKMKLIAKHIFWLIIILFSAINGFSQPKAEKGVLDLTNWNFESNELVKLDGEWEFYWNQFYKHEDFQNPEIIQKAEYINFPNYWNGYVSNNDTLSGIGYATYRLKIKIKKQEQHFAIKMLTVSTAYTLYINGKEIVRKGKIGKSRNEMIPAYKPALATFDCDTTELEIIMNISNFHHRAGGPWQVIKIGKASTIILKSTITSGIELFLIGSILIMALYHLGLFSIRRKERSPLYFALFCIFMTIRVAVTGEYAANLAYDWKWETLVFFEYLTFYTCILTFSAFLYSIFPKEYSIKVVYTFLGIYVIFTGFLFFTPVIFYSKTIGYFYIFLFLLAGYSIYALVLAIIRKRSGSFVFLIGFSILIFTTLNDILHQNDIIHTMNLSSAGIFGFIFVQAFLLSSRFSKAFFYTEKLSFQLDDMNKNLESTVKLRTSEIEMQKEELYTQAEYLKSTNEEITKQKNDLEFSHKRITESINYAKRIQNVIIPTTEALYNHKIDHFLFFRPRDIVSGDFYWIKEIGNNSETEIIIATADCTGHGVPGAFMSVLGITFLNEVILQQKITSPNKILNELRIRIKEALQQTSSSIEAKDGLDIALCNFNKNKKIIEYAGANNPLYRIKKIDELTFNNGINSKFSQFYKDELYFYELKVFQQNKMPIGIHYFETDFFNSRIEIEKDDIFYTFSDGYFDQFGGENGRKFLMKNFKNLLLKISSYDLEMQKEELETTFINWISDKYEQTDDILVMGFKPI